MASQAPQRQAKVERVWGGAKQIAGSNAFYLSAQGRSRRELRLDRTTGLPAHVTLERSDSLRETSDYVYESLPDGSIVHRATHLERAVLKGDKGKSVIDISFDNVHLEKRGRP